jgi:hypothetical protein
VKPAKRLAKPRRTLVENKHYSSSCSKVSHFLQEIVFGAFIASSACLFAMYFGEDFLRLFFGSASATDAAVFEILMLSMFPAIIVAVFGMQIMALYGGKLWVALCLAGGFLVPNLIILSLPQLFGRSLLITVVAFLVAKFAAALVLLVLGSRKVPVSTSFAKWSGALFLFLFAATLLHRLLAARAPEPALMYSAGVVSKSVVFRENQILPDLPVDLSPLYIKMRCERMCYAKNKQ